ncbi:type II toxin-antitoxin system RelB family antitoxin [Companilactobacillus sp. HBUAS56275]|uniref:CopG family transcriptional regulator n=1 Tax=Candidatus Companilactobacillus pullicola TaxID=2838523 RepID=A0A9D1ZPH1_9LACO|nr:CopG family transcriptional regulator [Candidatus Companilactobacillus pullicola]
MATISFHLDDFDEKVIRNYAKSKDMSLSSFLRSVAIEKIEDDIDDELYEQSLQNSKNECQDVTLDDLKKAMSRYY